jgi:hypothetical protein
MDQVTLRWFSRDLNSRGALVANALSDSLAEALLSNKVARLQSAVRPHVAGRAAFRHWSVQPRGQVAAEDRPIPIQFVLCGGSGAVPPCRVDPGAAGGQVLVGVHDVMGRGPTAPQAVDPAPGVLPDEAIIALEAQHRQSWFRRRRCCSGDWCCCTT